MARKNKKSYLYDSMRKHGIEQFDWKVVDTASSINQLNELETIWANKLRDQGITLYNNRETGGNKKHSHKSIEKMRQVQKLRHATTNVGGWKRKDGGAMLGKIHSKVSCLHCKEIIGVNVFFRSHGVKCREIV